MNHSSQSVSLEAQQHADEAHNSSMQTVSQNPQQPTVEQNSSDIIDVNVVLLTNYLRRHHVASFQEIQKRVRKLTVLLSVPMEPDRNWEAEWGGLDVVMQKNRMITANWKHSSGFSESNFIHIPTDTTKQLKRLKPDVILSYEMGMRTMLSSSYRLFRPKCRLVMVGNMSQHIEAERGPLRRSVRRIIKLGCDFFTYNGPSCKRYLKSLNISEEKLHPFPYCIDDDTAYRGPRHTPHLTVRKMVYCGSLSSRKGILQFATAARKWCESNAGQTIELHIAGGGELKQEISELGNENFVIKFLGNCDLAGLRSAYENADICVFPSLADEWGLVPIEAMASGLPVLGSFYAQSVEAYVTEGETGWVFRPDDQTEIEAAIGRAMQTTPERLLTMGETARVDVESISPANSANNICDLIRKINPNK